MKSYHSGWDIFLAEPGVLQEPQHCRVCGQQMDVTRNVHGPTSSIGAMFGSKRLHDQFACPNVGEKWHTQVYNLRRQAEDTPSAAIQKIIEDEIQQILKTRQPTKEVSD